MIPGPESATKAQKPCPGRLKQADMAGVFTIAPDAVYAEQTGQAPKRKPMDQPRRPLWP